MDKFSFLGSIHTSMVEEMYDKYIKDPNSVNENWASFFKGYNFANELYSEDDIPESFSKEFKVINLINSYRKRGHLFTKTNPVRERRKYKPTLDLENFDLQDSDLDLVFQAGDEVGIGPSKLSEIIKHLQTVYCQSIGIEYMYIRDPKEINWIKKRLHKNANTPNLKVNQKKHILHKLNQAVAFENFYIKNLLDKKDFHLKGRVFNSCP